MRELDTRGLAFHSPVLQPHLPELQAGARAHPRATYGLAPSHQYMHNTVAVAGMAA